MKPGIYLSVDRCPRHGFAQLSVMTLNEEGIGSGSRLLGPKTCCAAHTELQQWIVTPETLRAFASEFTAIADRSNERATVEQADGASV